MNILSYRGFEELCETWEGVFLRDKMPLHKSFVTFGNFIDIKILSDKSFVQSKLLKSQCLQWYLFPTGPLNVLKYV